MPTKTDQLRGKYAWSVADWCEATSLSRSMAYALMKRNVIRFVKVGDRRLIVDHPSEFLAKLTR
jgi:hypothetical protein